MGTVFAYIINVHPSVFQRMICIQQEIGKEHFQELCFRMNALLDVVIVYNSSALKVIYPS